MKPRERIENTVMEEKPLYKRKQRKMNPIPSDLAWGWVSRCRIVIDLSE
jgi:hypothetical protein